MIQLDVSMIRDGGSTPLRGRCSAQNGALGSATRLITCSCKIFVMTIQSDYESTSLFSPFQYPLLSLTKEDKGAMKVSCACRIYEKADF